MVQITMFVVHAATLAGSIILLVQFINIMTKVTTCQLLIRSSGTIVPSCSAMTVAPTPFVLQQLITQLDLQTCPIISLCCVASLGLPVVCRMTAQGAFTTTQHLSAT